MFALRAAMVTWVLVSAGAATAQTGFSWHIEGGGAVPITAFVDSAIRLDLDESNADQMLLSSSLVDAYAAPGMQIATTFMLEQFELRYSFHRFPWDREETRCTGSGMGVELPSGAIDDTLVVYDCDLNGAGTVQIDRDPAFLHVISLGYRIYFLEPGGAFNVYVVGAPGLGISSYNADSSDDGAAFGLNVGLGTGLSMRLSSLFSLGIEARYNMFLRGPPSSNQAAANRARALDQTAWAAAFDVFHYTSISLALQLSFR